MKQMTTNQVIMESSRILYKKAKIRELANYKSMDGLTKEREQIIGT